MLNEEDVNKIKKMYKEEFGQKITDEQAVEYAKSLLDLMRAVYL